MINFEITNQTRSQVNSKLIKAIINNFSEVAKITEPVNLSLVLVDRRLIKKWNLIYRGKDKATDVLSFAERDAEAIPGEAKELGEILICLPVAKDQAKEYGWSLDQEITRLLVHGLAHLIGYEHEGVSEKEAAKMTKFEAQALEKFSTSLSSSWACEGSHVGLQDPSSAEVASGWQWIEHKFCSVY